MAVPVSDQSPLVPGEEGAVVVKPGPKASPTQMTKLQLDPRTLNGSRSFNGYTPLAAGGFACSNAPFPSCSHGAHEPRIQHTDLSAAPIRMHMRPSLETRRLLCLYWSRLEVSLCGTWDRLDLGPLEDLHLRNAHRLVGCSFVCQSISLSRRSVLRHQQWHVA